MSTTVPVPSPAAEAFTGERFLPSCSGEIAYEHWHRYAFARRFATGKRVLDAACGEGYGTALLGAVAESAVGIDFDMATITHARATYGKGTRVRFVPTSCTGLPMPSASFDLIVSFETIEHLSAEEQPDMLSEFARVLAPDGLLIISSPNKHLYSDARDYVNPFHLQELYRDDLARLLGRRFPAQRWYHQRLAFWSGIWPEPVPAEGDEPSPVVPGLEAWVGDAANILPYPGPEAMYFVVIAARDAQALPFESTNVSLFTDVDDSERKRAHANASEALRLDALLRESDAAVARHTHHIHHLEQLVGERDRLIAERDAALANDAAQLRALEAQVGERDATLGERDRQLAAANAAQEERDAELAHRAETIAGLGKRSAALEAEKERLQTELALDHPRIAYLNSFRGWITWPWRHLQQWLGG
jgi:SAM-dependent methyltransferase